MLLFNVSATHQQLREPSAHCWRTITTMPHALFLMQFNRTVWIHSVAAVSFKLKFVSDLNAPR
jgi:hypothetical protein